MTKFIKRYIIVNMNAEEIKALRTRLGMTQHELAEKLGVDQVSVNKWERKKNKPGRLATRQLDRLARKNKERIS